MSHLATPCHRWSPTSSTMEPTNIDNLFASAWNSLNLNRRLEAAGFAKRSGIEVTETVFVLMVWRWLNVSSIAVFCRTALSVFSRAKKDVLYDFLKREDIHWRKLNLHTAKALYRQHALHHSQVRAYVLDDSIKARRGKKMEMCPATTDHTTHRHVMGQQVLTLGLVTEEAFVPLDSQLYVSTKKAQSLNRRHKDRRSIGAQRYREATTRSKPQMALGMMKRAKRSGIEADYMVADAWFGTKTMLRAAYELGVCAVLRMKKGAMKYRVHVGEGETQMLDAKEIFAQQVRKRWRKVRGLPWRAVSVEVELDVSETKARSAQWQRVQLLFVRGVHEPGEPEVGKKDWAVFVCTDPALAVSKMLEVYALRWGIEVYFKEAKQHLASSSSRRDLRLPYRLDSSVCDSLPDAGPCQAQRRRGSDWTVPCRHRGAVESDELCRAFVANLPCHHLRYA